MMLNEIGILIEFLMLSNKFDILSFSLKTGTMRVKIGGVLLSLPLPIPVNLLLLLIFFPKPSII